MSNFDPVAALKIILGTNYVIYTKTQNFHWNVVGPHFHNLHVMFEGQYTELAEANDELAERIRALGELAPGTHAAFNELSLVPEQPEHISAEKMVAELLDNHETLIAELKKVIPMYADAKDDGTADLLTARCEAHQKTAWMLRSFLG